MSPTHSPRSGLGFRWPEDCLGWGMGWSVYTLTGEMFGNGLDISLDWGRVSAVGLQVVQSSRGNPVRTCRIVARRIDPNSFL